MSNYNTIVNTRPDLRTMKFQNSKRDFETTSLSSIMMQRLTHFFKCTCQSNTYTKGEDDIEVNRQDGVTDADITNFFGSRDIETGAVIDPSNLEMKQITNPENFDRVFRSACNEASNTCVKYAKGFMLMAKFTKINDFFTVAILPLAISFDLGKNILIAAFTAIIVINVLNILFDWPLLMEKYAGISIGFSNLANSKNENRFDEYEALVDHYRSSWLYSDSIKLRG